jgi:hypothetical protein
MPENGGPLSVPISSGIPIHENKVSNAGKTYIALVELTSIPKGKRECLSMITNNSLLFGNGPKKSFADSCQGYCGNSVIFNSSGLFPLLFN